MSYQELLPGAELHSHVRAFWQVEEEHLPGLEEHRFMPERAVSLIFYAGQSWQGPPHAEELAPVPGAGLSGLALEPLRVVSAGLTRALGVDLYPWAARQLFDWNIGPAYQDLGPRYPRLTREVCALLELGRGDEAREMLEAWLLALYRAHVREPGKAVVAATRLYGSLGQARIGVLAEELNLSPRQLERHFVQEIGVSAKTLARLIRFEEMHNRLWLDPDTPLAGLAGELGFADQAHLAREFRALSLMTPRQFAEFTRLRGLEARDGLSLSSEQRLLEAPSTPSPRSAS